MCCLTLLVLLLSGSLSSLPASAPPAPAPVQPLPAAARAAESLAGWAVTFSDSDPDTPDLRTRVPAAALALLKGESPHPTLGVENNVAVFEGGVDIPVAGRWRFALRVDGGAATLMVLGEDGLALLTHSSAGAGRTETDWIELEAGTTRVSVLFKRKGVARTRLRTLWSFEGQDGDGFGLEPIPTRVVSVPVELRSDVDASLAARAGRVLLGRKGCTGCHEPSPAIALHVTERTGPDLSEVGARLGSAWMRRWIADPAAMLPGADMPSLMDGAEQAELDDLVAFLMSLSGDDVPDLSSVATEPVVHARGRELYHSIGCVACHGALEAPAAVFSNSLLSGELGAEPSPVPFGDLAGKWRPASLSAFLRDPEATRPNCSMPELDVSGSEADDLAHYLLGLWGAAPAMDEGSEAPGSVERGRKWFILRRCNACHELDDAAELRPAPTLVVLDADASGCISGGDPDAPRYDLSTTDRTRLAAGLREVKAVTPHTAPVDAAERVLSANRCHACHAMEGAGGVMDEDKVFFRALDERTDLGDEGRLPPDLSGVGFRLTTQWMRDLLLEGARSRPYMAARMPAYPSHALEGLAEMFGRREGLWPDGDYPAPPVTDGAVLAGRRLMDTQVGLACEACHVHGDRPPVGSPGLAMTGFAERLRYEWFRAYMPDPSRFKPGTRMPSFATGGVSAETGILEGDAMRQQEAMWAYFSLGEFSPPPTDAAAADGMVLSVGERPRVFRSFLREAGSRGIAVGFPVGIHFAFDASTCRLVDVWQGAFLNAAGSWAGRGGTPLGGQDESLWTAGEAGLFELDEPLPPSFGGYRLDAGGVPTFLYKVGEMSVEDRIVPRLLAPATLIRTLTLRGVPASLLLHAASGGSSIAAAEADGARVAPVEGRTGTYRVTRTGPPDGPVIVRLEIML